jgi:phosphoribosylglycinamide formyltransferase-1
MSYRLAVLVSGSGTLLQSLIDAQAVGELRAEIAVVGADRDGIEALARAERASIPTFVRPLAKDADRTAWDAGLSDTLASVEPDLVVSAGFMKLLGASCLARFDGRIINTHPALLPSFPGMHGVRDALAHGVKVTGCTVFVVDAGLDTGRILAQEPVRVLPGDSEASLHERIKVVERSLLVATINALAAEGT